MSMRSRIGLCAAILAGGLATSPAWGQLEVRSQRVVCDMDQGGTTVVTLDRDGNLASYRGNNGNDYVANGSVRTRRGGSRFFFGFLGGTNGTTIALEINDAGWVTRFLLEFTSGNGSERSVGGSCRREHG